MRKVVIIMILSFSIFEGFMVKSIASNSIHSEMEAFILNDSIICPSEYTLSSEEIDSIIARYGIAQKLAIRYKEESEKMRENLKDLRVLYQNLKIKIKELDKQKTDAEDATARAALTVIRQNEIAATEKAEKELALEKLAAMKDALASADEDVRYFIEYSQELEKKNEELRNLLLESTFCVAAEQEGVKGIGRWLGIKRIEDRLPMNKNNSYNIKKSKVKGIYLEARVGAVDEEIPAYYLRLEYTNSKNETSIIIGKEKSVLLPTENGLIDFRLNFDYQKKGIYTLFMEFEEDEKLVRRMSYRFLID